MTNQGVQAAGRDRFDAAQAVARSAGALALEYFRRVETLVVEHKGSQIWSARQTARQNATFARNCSRVPR